MSDDAPTTAAAPVVPDFSAPGEHPLPVAAQETLGSGSAQAASARPEVVVGGAFAAGFLLAKLLRRRGD